MPQSSKSRTKRKNKQGTSNNNSFLSSSINSSAPSFEVETESAITLEDVMKEINEIKQSLASVKDEIIQTLRQENEELRETVEILKEEISKKDELIESIEKDVVNVDQYNRRNNLEIVGIPDEIPQNSLEETVIKIASCLDVKVTKSDVEACHRLRKKPNYEGNANVIVRFVNRKSVENLMAKRRMLKNKNLSNLGIHGKVYLNNNLCPYNKYLMGQVKNLFTHGIIKRF